MATKDITARWEWPLRRFAWLEVVWGGFALAKLGAMWLVPTWETVPFHFIWVSLTLVYGFQVWNLASSRARGLRVDGGLPLAAAAAALAAARWAKRGTGIARGTSSPTAASPSARAVCETVSVVEAVREDRCQALMPVPRYDSLCNWHPSVGCLQV
jgi:hypothetical protein